MGNFSNHEVRSGAINIFLIIMEKALGFLKQIVFAYFFGSKFGTDMYYLAQNVVSIVNTCFNTSLPVSFLSVFVFGNMRKKKVEDQTQFISKVLFTFLLIAFILTAVMFFFGTIIENISSDLGIKELSKYIKVLSVIIVFYCLSGLLGAALECLGQYTPSKLASLFISISSIIGILICGEKYGVIIAIYTSLIGIFIHVIYVFFILYRRIKIRFIKPQLDQNVKKILKLSLPMMMSTAIASINSLIDKSIASRLDEGSISALNYAHIVSIELITALVITAVGSILMSKFAEVMVEKNYDMLKKIVVKTWRIMVVFVLPVFILYIEYSQEIISIFFQRGEFKQKEVEVTAIAFLGYSISLMFIPFREVLMRVQYAYQDSRNPMYNSICCVAVNIVLSYLLSGFWNVFGIALATSISIILNTILNYCCVYKKGKLKIEMGWGFLSKIVLMGIVLFKVCDLVHYYLNKDSFYTLIVGVFGCGSTYALMLILFFKKEVIQFLKR